MSNTSFLTNLHPRRAVSPVRLAAVSGAVTAGIGLGLVIAHGTTLGIDFHAYWVAAGHLMSGEPLYPHGLGIGSLDAYPYPPLLAQVLIPVRALTSFTMAKLLWTAINAAALATTIVLAWRVGGGRFDARGLVSLAPLTFLFLPAYSALLVGNVSLLVALALALALAGGPSRTALAALAAVSAVKLSPVLLLAPAVVRANRRALLTVLAGAAGMLALAIVAAPGAWVDFTSHLRDLTAGTPASQSSDLEANVIRGLPVSAVAVHLTGFAIGAALELAALAAARSGRWYKALAAAVGALLVAPGVIWYHYFVILLPLILVAWPSLSKRTRFFVGLGYLGLSLPVGPLPLAGAAIMVAALLFGSGSAADAIRPQESR